MDRNLALELVRVTETSALVSSKFMCRGDTNGTKENSKIYSNRYSYSFCFNKCININKCTSNVILY